MVIQCYIFNWKGHAKHVDDLIHSIGGLVETTVINSDPSQRARGCRWINLGEHAYFSEQWNAATAAFQGDAMFHIQADAHCEDFCSIFNRARSAFERWPVGVYEPNVDYTAITYERSKLSCLAEDIYEIPIPDCTCWFLSSEVIREFPKVDTRVNRYGWGISAAAAALAGLCGRRCLRDYGLKVRHPKSRGYDTATAIGEYRRYLVGLDAAIRSEAIRRVKQRFRCSCLPPHAAWGL